MLLSLQLLLLKEVLLLKLLLTSSLPIAMLLLRIAFLPSLSNQSNHLPKIRSLTPTVLRPLPSNAKSAAILWILQANVNIAKRPSG
jgi:hypothetical protein